MFEGMFKKKAPMVEKKDNVVEIHQGHTVADQFGTVIGSADTQEDAVKKFRQNAIEQREAA
jgi:hypothetical protein